MYILNIYIYTYIYIYVYIYVYIYIKYIWIHYVCIYIIKLPFGDAVYHRFVISFYNCLTKDRMLDTIQ